MCRANPLRGAPIIHGELRKLEIEISETSVSKYMVRPRGPPAQTWRAFLDNHVKDLIALDFFTVPTATFRVLVVLVILRHDRRRILQLNVTAHPTTAWIAQQLLEACGTEERPGYLIRDQDSIYGEAFQRQAAALKIDERLIAYQSPWQNPYAERVIGSIRRECLDHVVVLGERHLKRILSSYMDYYNGTRTHLSLDKHAPKGRIGQSPAQGRVVQLARVGGLHHEYVRMAA
jgi:transposase InsO family protein